MLVVADPRWRGGDHRAWLATTALFVGAMLAKPTLAPVTIFVFGVAIIACTVLHARTREDTLRVVKVALMAGSLGLVLVLPYYVVSFPHIYDYIQTNAFGSQASVWALKLPLRDHLLYYLVGPGGSTAIGGAWLLLAALLVLAALPLLDSWRRTLLGVALVSLAAYASVTAPTMKSPFIGLIVPALVLVVAFAAALVILARLRNRAAAAVAIVLLAISVATWRPISFHLWSSTVPTMQSQSYQRIYMETVNALATVPDLDKHKLYFPVIAQYLNQDNVEFELRRRNLAVPTTSVKYLNGNIDFQRAQLAQSDLVVLFSDGSPLPLPWPATTSIRKEITDTVAKTGAFEIIAEIDGGPSYPGKVIVMKRRGS